MTDLKLRLVAENDSPSALHTEIISNLHQKGQYSFNFDEPVFRMIVIVAMEELHGAKLHSVFDDFNPKLVIDLRYSVRFDLPGSSRAMFFENLKKIKANYLRVPIEWHLLAAAPIAVDVNVVPQRLHFEVVERQSGNVFLIVSKMLHGRHLASTLNILLTKYSASAWKFEYAAS